MTSEALVQLALDELGCNQKELGLRIGVSPTQISKWKKGEHMSFDMREKLRKVSNIGDRDPEFVLSAGSLGDADKWARLIGFIASRAYENSETGYYTYPLSDEDEARALLCVSTFNVLTEMGATIPGQFPPELDTEYMPESEEEAERVEELLDQNRYSTTITKIYESLNDVYGFYAAYISELMDDEALDLTSTPAENIEPCLVFLAASKIDMDPAFAPNFASFRSRIRKEYLDWLEIVRDKTFRAGVPLRAEILGLVYESHNALGHEAEAESLGFNASRIHPDIYMNELLVGMRTIHQVLPAILKKLDIFDEFEIDHSELRLGE